MVRLVRTGADFDAETIQAWYGPVRGLKPPEVAELFTGSGVRWAIAGGRAARVGAEPRVHEDTDVEIPYGDLARVREHLIDWHLWQALDGALKPLLPDDAPEPAMHQLWVRRDSSQPWAFELLCCEGDTEWTCRRDPRLRLPFAQAHHVVDGVTFLRPELALLYKAKNDRPKDRADLEAAVLDPVAWTWLATQLERLGYREWGDRARARGASASSSS